MNGLEPCGQSGKGVPLFDCLTHPTMSGNWLSGSEADCARLDMLVKHMDEYGVRWAFAVGMKGIGGYDAEGYSRFITEGHSRIIPVAYFDFTGIRGSHAVHQALLSLKEKGYRGIKIHPRHARISLKHPMLPHIINHAMELDMAAMLCTYFYDTHENSLSNNLETLVSLLHETRDSRVILLHAGTVRLMEMIEIARAYRNVLLDLSFTLCKYEGSSVDLDIAYAFRNFDRRICVGSDFPEFPIRKMRERYEYFSSRLERDKQENIAFRNILEFTGIKEL